MQAVPRWQKTGERRYFKSRYHTSCLSLSLSLSPCLFKPSHLYSLLNCFLSERIWVWYTGISRFSLLSIFPLFLSGIITFRELSVHISLEIYRPLSLTCCLYIHSLPLTPLLSIIPLPAIHPPCQAGCRLAISCTRPVEPLSEVECWLLVCLSGWLTVRAALLKCLIWSMFVCGALSPHLILTALTVCAGSLSPSCCTLPPPPPAPPSILCLYLHSLSIPASHYSLSTSS